MVEKVLIMKKRGVYMSVIDSIKQSSDKYWMNIPDGIVHETTITENILTDIYDDNKQTPISKIEYKQEPEYKESRTSADFVLVIKDRRKQQHWLAFQAKIGSKPDNTYEQIIHYIKGKKTFQIDVFAQWLSDNDDVDGYYVFYNGNYRENEPIKTSYYIEELEKVKTLMTINDGKYDAIRLEDLIHSTTHMQFSELLEEVIEHA